MLALVWVTLGSGFGSVKFWSGQQTDDLRFDDAIEILRNPDVSSDRRRNALGTIFAQSSQGIAAIVEAARGDDEELRRQAELFVEMLGRKLEKP